MSRKDDLANPRCFPGCEYAFLPSSESTRWQQKAQAGAGRWQWQRGHPMPAAPRGLPGQHGGLAHLAVT